jgi:alpha/beta superfamily hydrolase
LSWLEHTFHKRPILFAGFSFGSYVGLRACCGDVRVKGTIALGLPVRAEGRDYRYGFMPKCVAPKLFVLGDHDQFAPKEAVEEVFARAPEPKRLVWIAGGDHFFQGIEGSPGAKLGLMQEAMRGWLGETFGLG